MVEARLPINHSQTRLEHLDTLRLGAALVVLLSHAFAMVPTQQTGVPMIEGLFHPKSAVSFFFVLSGFVLHLSWKGVWPSWNSWCRFIVRRVFRIYPLYYTALILASLVIIGLPLKDCPLFVSDETGVEVANADHRQLIQWIHHLFLVTPGLDMQFLNPPIWTLAAEMRIAFIFPWLSWLCRHLHWKFCLGCLVLVFSLAPYAAKWTVPTVNLLPLFLLGAFIAEHRSYFDLVKGNRAWMLLLVGIVVYSIAPLVRGNSPLSLIWQMDVAAVGASLVVLSLQRLTFLRRVFENRILVFCGQSSYGIYILHFPILMGLAFAGWKKIIPISGIIPIAILLTITLSMLLNRLIELPSIEYSRKLVRSSK